MTEPCGAVVEWGPNVLRFADTDEAVDFSRELGGQAVTYRLVWVTHAT